MSKLVAFLLTVQTLLLALIALNTIPRAEAGDGDRRNVVIVDHAISRFDPLPVQVVGSVDCE